MSWISTANAIAARGAKVVFADVDPRTLNLDPAEVARKITPRTKAILPVHLYGQCCDMDALAGTGPAARHSHRRGLRPRRRRNVQGRKAGALGDIGVFSFHQQKNMVTLGEGGMVTTNDPELYERLLSYRSLCCLTYDPKGKYLPIDESVQPMGKRYWLLDFADVGYNFRMTDAQAAVGLVQLAKLDGFNAAGGKSPTIYRAAARQDPPGSRCRTSRPTCTHVYHVFCVLVEPELSADRKKTSCGSCTRASNQGLVALHADPPDDGLSQLGASRGRMSRGPKRCSINTSACRSIRG